MDNTYQYQLPPILFETFMSQMLESNYGQSLLRELKEKYNELFSKLPYTIVDYINSTDLIVRYTAPSFEWKYRNIEANIIEKRKAIIKS